MGLNAQHLCTVVYYRTGPTGSVTEFQLAAKQCRTKFRPEIGHIDRNRISKKCFVFQAFFKTVYLILRIHPPIAEVWNAFLYRRLRLFGGHINPYRCPVDDLAVQPRVVPLYNFFQIVDTSQIHLCHPLIQREKSK